ncbi:hypothetical protein G5B35_04580 [Parapusillimonas sp. SGNA-6]|jgi:hypothetical protein|nr:hypothetical protein [Parapusillimonas sp. SGNA-6]
MSELPEKPRNSSTPPVDEQHKEAAKVAPQPRKTSADPAHKATQFDGNPNPQSSESEPSTLGPKDDTPAFLEKKSGPKQ